MRDALIRGQPEFDQVAALRRYIRLRYQRFVEWHVCSTDRGRRFVRRSYDRMEGVEHLDNALEAGSGAIILIFHFGLATMVWPTLRALGYECWHHVFRGATYAGKTYDWVARAAMLKLADNETATGLNLIYHRPFLSFAEMVRHLRSNHCVGINGDGMMGTDFVEVPFLDGVMSFPTGPARLAARSGAPILPVFCWSQGLFERRVLVYPQIRCAEDSPEVVEECIRAYVAQLDAQIRQDPGAWWTWRRLQISFEQDRPRLEAKALAADKGWYHSASPRQKRDRVQESRAS
jgi:lauroyl/myristoyl acyltransferase